MPTDRLDDAAEERIGELQDHFFASECPGGALHDSVDGGGARADCLECSCDLLRSAVRYGLEKATWEQATVGQPRDKDEIAHADRLAEALLKQGEFIDRVGCESRVDSWFELAVPALREHEERRK